ncbi:MAG: hypothetical protein EXR77_12170 [Myxococcales bacterium]|nr:hypothetical protein [Myxococcales bacterium]
MLWTGLGQKLLHDIALVPVQAIVRVDFIVRTHSPSPVFGYAAAHFSAQEVQGAGWSAGGLSLSSKRLEQGCFRVPVPVPGHASVQMSAADLAMLLDGIDWTRARRQKLYEPPRSLATGGSTSGSN